MNHFKLPQKKFCCNGQHTEIVTPIKSVKKGKVLWRRALYRCKKCHEYSIRGETDDLPMNNTSVDIITKEEASRILEEKKRFLEKMRSRKNESQMA